MTGQIRTGIRDKVSVDVIAHTTHVVNVDVAAVLAGLQIDFADTVVITLQTPSGRAKRVTLNPSWLIEPHHVDDYAPGGVNDPFN